MAIDTESHPAARLIRLTGGAVSLADVASIADAVARPPEAHERLIILAGKDDFCIGREPGPPPPHPSVNLRIRDRIAKPILSAYDAIASATLPVVAVVSGRALGFGCALAAICDLTYAHPAAIFSLPELEKGVPPTLAMRAVVNKAGTKALADWILTGREFDAREALNSGLLSAISHEPESDALKLAVRLQPQTIRALASVKTFLAAADHGADGLARLAAELVAATMSEPKDR
jgi:enoyl-CoA hydratase